MKQYPSQARLRELFDYDPEGFLVWKYNKQRSAQWNGRYAGKRAGQYVLCDRTLQYIYRVGIGQKIYSGNSLIWIFFGGCLDEKKQVNKIDWSMPPSIENLVQLSASERKPRPFITSKQIEHKGLSKCTLSGFWVCTTRNRCQTRFPDQISALTHYDNEYEKEKNVRPNQTKYKDVSNRVLKIEVLRQIQHAKKSIRNGRFSGVSKHRKKWKALCANRYVGVFDTEEQAARAYNIAAREHYGEHAILNDIPDPLGTGEIF